MVRILAIVVALAVLSACSAFDRFSDAVIERVERIEAEVEKVEIDVALVKATVDAADLDHDGKIQGLDELIALLTGMIDLVDAHATKP